VKRVLASAGVGLAGVGGLLVPTLLLEKWVEAGGGGAGLRPLLRAAFWALGWPLPLFGRLFPAPQGSPLKYSATALSASLLCDAALLALLAYLLLGRGARRRARRQADEFKG
jgi:hypothetical protein